MPLNSAMVGRKSRRFRHEVDARWLMAYAASLGETAPCYFDTTGTIAAHPMFPVCVEWPVVLDARNLEGAQTLTREEGAKGVHATHDLVIHEPIGAGMEVFTTATVTGIETRKPGAYQMTKLQTLTGDGKLLATTWQGGLFRGVAVSGGDRSVESPPPLPSAADARVDHERIDVPVAAGAAHTYTECARIWNPIHTDKRVAVAAGLPDIILHGTATLALGVSAIVNERLGADPRCVRRIAARFAGMVLMPNTLTVNIGASDAKSIFFSVATSDGTVAIRDGFVGFER